MIPRSFSLWCPYRLLWYSILPFLSVKSLSPLYKTNLIALLKRKMKECSPKKRNYITTLWSDPFSTKGRHTWWAFTKTWINSPRLNRGHQSQMKSSQILSRQLSNEIISNFVKKTQSNSPKLGDQMTFSSHEGVSLSFKTMIQFTVS